MILLGLVLTEGLLRLWNPPLPAEPDRPLYLVGPPQISPLRERPEIAPKLPGVFRIFVLGDSFTWGANVPMDYTYPKLLEWLSNRSSSVRYEVYNFGVNGANTDGITVATPESSSERRILVMIVLQRKRLCLRKSQQSNLRESKKPQSSR